MIKLRHHLFYTVCGFGKVLWGCEYVLCLKRGKERAKDRQFFRMFLDLCRSHSVHTLLDGYSRLFLCLSILSVFATC